MDTMTSRITSLTIVYSTIYSGADQSKHQSSASLAFVWGIHRELPAVPGEFPAQMASNAENVSIRSRHHETGQDGQIRIHENEQSIFQRICVMSIELVRLIKSNYL